ncbi:MAG: L,D-transpeptidase [Chloroflexota bacterium]|nr:L,D-transpeptidase [Chloroflexota bacterium]
MTNKTFSRRNFIKLAALSFGSLAFNPMIGQKRLSSAHKLVRVSGSGNISSVSIHKQPNDESQILYQRYKDDLINVYDVVESEFGPEFNPIWYRVWGGYAHRKWLVEVDTILNPLTDTIHEDGQLGEITVPYTRSYRYSSFYGWEPVYRLYYQTYHWIRDIVTGPDGKPWYELEDELSRLRFAVPAEQMRIVPDSEFEPISPDVPPEEKSIDISIFDQQLTAYEGNDVVFQTKISSGVLTPAKRTPVGDFRIGVKMPSKHMGNGQVTSDIMAYELVGVPWNCFFELENGIASHGAYWHDSFGTPMSSGCINMRIHEASWLFRWTNPVCEPNVWTANGTGTRVHVA